MSLKEFLHGWYGDDLPRRARDLWLGLDPWPIDAGDHVFLAQAVMEVGRALYPGAWSDLDPVRAFLPLLNTSPFPTDGDAAVYAVDILGRLRPDLGIGPELEFSFRDRPLSLEEMDAAVAAYLDHEAKPNALAAARFASVQKAILISAASGQLRTFRRRVEKATEFISLDKSVWLSSEAGRRFAFCVINEHEPYSEVVVPWAIWEELKATSNANNPYRWQAEEVLAAYPSYVYVSRSDLSKLCAEIAGGPLDDVKDMSDPTRSTSQTKATRRRIPQEQARVRPVLDELFPEGIPAKDQMTNARLIKVVTATMADKSRQNRSNQPAPSPETILRAAGRK